MSRMSETKNIIVGCLILLGFHILAFLLILLIALSVETSFTGYAPIYVIFYGVFGFSLWQLFYVIPLCLWLKKRDKTSLMKGVIIGAIITFLVNGGCFLLTMGG
jgi:hypothetical protein